MNEMTKDKLMELAGVKTNAALAEWWTQQTGKPVTRQAVHLWGQRAGGVLPEIRQWQCRALIASGKIEHK